MTKNRSIAEIFFQGANTQTLESQTSLPVWNDNTKPGDVIMSFDAGSRQYYAELNGQTITNGATDYPIVAARYTWMVSGSNLVLPDARGRFLRSWAHGSANDPDRASRTARAGDGQTGDYPGTYQAYEFYAHDHSYRSFGTGGSSFDGTSNSRTYETTQVSGAPISGGNETRPGNVNVSYWMRLK